MEEDDTQSPAPTLDAPPALPQPRCPHCSGPLDQIGWLHNSDAGLLTYFHAKPSCMVALNVQGVQPARRIEMPPQTRPPLIRPQ